MRKYRVIILLLLSVFIIQRSIKAQGIAKDEETWRIIAPYVSPPKEYKNKYAGYRSPLSFYDGLLVKNKGDWERRRKEIRTMASNYGRPAIRNIGNSSTRGLHTT